MAAAAARFAPAAVIGCTTAGEIGAEGYVEGTIVAIGLARASFAAVPVLVPDLDAHRRRADRWAT